MPVATRQIGRAATYAEPPHLRANCPARFSIFDLTGTGHFCARMDIMARFRIDLRASAFRSVLGFTFSHWRRQPWRVSLVMGGFLLSTIADVLTPLYSGRLVDAVASGAASDTIAWNAAMAAFLALIALALAGLVVRNLAFMGLVDLTLKMMADIAADAFHRVQRFSTDWHANSFAGSTVRKVTRGMWALDLLNDTILIALLPSVAMLVGSTLLLGWFWPLMGLVVAVGSVLFITVTALLSLGYVAPAARLANSWDTRLGGSLADAVSCNAVVKGFGAETREETRLAKVVAKWRARTQPHLGARHHQRHHARRHASGAANGGDRAVADAVGLGPGERRRCRLRADLVLRAAGLSPGYRHAYPQFAAFDQRHGGTGRFPVATARHRGPARRDSRSGSPTAISASTTSPSTMAAIACRSTATFRWRSRRASGSDWSVIPARARRRSSS